MTKSLWETSPPFTAPARDARRSRFFGLRLEPDCFDLLSVFRFFATVGVSFQILLTRVFRFFSLLCGSVRCGSPFSPAGAPKTRLPAPALISWRGARSLNRITSPRKRFLFFMCLVASAETERACVRARARAALDPFRLLRGEAVDLQGLDLSRPLFLGLRRHRSRSLSSEQNFRISPTAVSDRRTRRYLSVPRPRGDSAFDVPALFVRHRLSRQILDSLDGVLPLLLGDHLESPYSEAF